MSETESFWKKCSTCKAGIGFKKKYWVCNVSTCNGKRTGLIFCSISCFERHLPGARHKDAYAVEETSPSASSDPIKIVQNKKIIIHSNSIPAKTIVDTHNSNSSKDVLVVVSKLKDYIQLRSGMSTSASCMAVLSDLIRRECDKAILKAKNEGRKTVLDRDFK